MSIETTLWLSALWLLALIAFAGYFCWQNHKQNAADADSKRLTTDLPNRSDSARGSSDHFNTDADSADIGGLGEGHQSTMENVWMTDKVYDWRRMEFKLSNGRIVRVVRFRYSGTYDGVLEGRPKAPHNKEIIQRNLEAFGKPLLLPPETRTDHCGGVYLPPICCSAELESEAIQDGCGSTLTVVWFAPPFFAEPLAAFIERSLKELAWEHHAEDFEY